MRFFLQLLTLLALLVAPLAASAAANAPVQSSVSECSQMQSGHKAPASHHSAGAPCCVAIPAAIDQPASKMALLSPSLHPTFVAVSEQFLLGSGPQFDDPPPRIA